MSDAVWREGSEEYQEKSAFPFVQQQGDPSCFGLEPQSVARVATHWQQNDWIK